MGTRYILKLDCPHCGKMNEGIWYAPTCDATDWRCEHCDKKFDIEEFFKVSCEEASNLDEIEEVIASYKKQLYEMTDRELEQFIQSLNDKLEYCQLAHKSTKHQLEASNLLKGILRRKLKVAQEAVRIVKRLCDTRRDCEGIEERIRKLRSAGKYVLMKWKVIQ